MTSRSRLVSCLFALSVVAGGALPCVTNGQTVASEKIRRPDHILVYDFVASPADVPADSAIAGQYAPHSTPQTADQIQTGRQVGAQIARELVANIRAMGLPAGQASSQTAPRIGDLVIRGYLLSIETGSAAERVAIGFGSGASELRVAVEGYQMTDRGLRKLGSGAVDSTGSKSPGTAASLAVAVATGNPLGLIVSGGKNISGEESGSSTIEGRAKDTAKAIADQLRPRFEQQGWIK